MSETFRRLLPVYMLLLFRNTAWSLSVSGPVLPLYIRSLGIDIVDWSFIATAHAVGLIVFEGLWGTISDRIDRNRMLVGALICMGLVFPFYTVKSLVPYFIVLQFAVGAFAVAIGPTTRAMVADGSPEESRGFYMSVWFTFFTLGSMIGPILGIYIADLMGYEYAFYASAAVLLSGAAIFGVFFRGNSGKVTPKERGAGSVRGDAATLLSVPSVVLIFMLTVSIFTGMPAVRAFLPIYAAEEVGMSNVSIGVMLTISSGLQLVVMPVLGRLSDRFSRRLLIAAGLAGMFTMSMAFYLVETPLQLVLATTVISIFGCVSSLVLATLSKVAPRELSGMAMGMYGSFEDLGLIIGPVIYGLIWNGYEPALIFPAAAVTSLLGLVFLSRIRE